MEGVLCYFYILAEILFTIPGNSVIFCPVPPHNKFTTAKKKKKKKSSFVSNGYASELEFQQQT